MSAPALADYEDKLRQTPFVKGLPERVADQIVAILKQIAPGREVESGEVLFRKGKEDENVGILLLDGSVDIDMGDNAPMREEAPELFGEMLQLDEKKRRTATVRVVEKAVVFEFSWHNFVTMALHALGYEDQLRLREVLTAQAGVRFKELAEHAGPDRRQFRNTLQDLALIQELPEEWRSDVIDSFLAVADVTALSAGDVLYKKGAADENTGALLAQGAARIDRVDGESKDLRAPDLLGELMQYTDDQVRTATVTATEDAVLLAFPWDDFVSHAKTTLNSQQQGQLKTAFQKLVDERLEFIERLGE